MPTSAVPRSLAEVIFEPHDPLVLLNLARDRGAAQPDHDYEGYGWARLPNVTLEASDGGTQQQVGPVLLLAIHSADEQPSDTEIEVELDLPVPDDDEPLAILAPLPALLRALLPRLPDDAPHVVLALCNPRCAPVKRPSALGSRTLHYAHGDVVSWLDEFDDGRTAVRLDALRWFST